MCSACGSTIYGYVKYARNSGPLITHKLWKVKSIPFRCTAASLQTIGLIGLFQEFKSPLQLKSSQQLMIEGNAHLLRENQSYYVEIICPVEHEPLGVMSFDMK